MRSSRFVALRSAIMSFRSESVRLTGLGAAMQHKRPQEIQFLGRQRDAERKQPHLERHDDLLVGATRREPEIFGLDQRALEFGWRGLVWSAAFARGVLPEGAEERDELDDVSSRH